MVTLTPTAAQRIKRLAQERQLLSPTLRLATIPGGCSGSGYQYDMRLESQVSPNDLIFEVAGAQVVVDPDSYPLVAGATLDYEETLMKSGFTVRNPNAVSTCACGRSFRVTEDATPFH